MLPTSNLIDHFLQKGPGLRVLQLKNHLLDVSAGEARLRNDFIWERVQQIVQRELQLSPTNGIGGDDVFEFQKEPSFIRLLSVQNLQNQVLVEGHVVLVDFSTKLRKLPWSKSLLCR